MHDFWIPIGSRSVYGVARGRGTTSLRVLDFGVIGTAWLLGYLAGYAGDLPFGVRRFIPYLLIPLIVDAASSSTRSIGPLRTGLAVRLGRGSRARSSPAVVHRGVRLDLRARVATPDVRHMTLPLLTAPPVAALLILLGCGGIRFQARLFALERQRDGRSTPACAPSSSARPATPRRRARPGSSSSAARSATRWSSASSTTTRNSS